MNSSQELIPQKKPVPDWKANLGAVLTHPLFAAALIMVLTFSVYYLMLVRPLNLFDSYDQPRLDAVYTRLNHPYNQVRLLVTSLLLGGLYLAGWVTVSRIKGRLAWAVVLAGALACAIVLLFLMPFDAADIFDNILHGRILAVYDGNPFVQTGVNFRSDPFYEYMAWKVNPTAYGPVWELFAGLTARLAGNGIIANILAFKLLPGTFWAGSLLLVGVIMLRVMPQAALSGVYLLALNPVVLFSTFGNGHNDIVIMFWILLAVWAMVADRHILAILALVVGALVKFIPVLLLPAAGLVIWRKLQGIRKRLLFLIGTAAGGLLLIWLTYLPFWDGLGTLSIERRANMFTTSLPSIAFHILSPTLDKEQAALFVSIGAIFATLFFILWRVRPTRLGGSWPGFPQASFDVLAFYLLFTCLWFQQWYTIWLVGLAAVLPPGHSRRFAVFFSFAAMGKSLILGPLLFRPKPIFSQPAFEILFTVGVLGLSWIYYLAKFNRPNKTKDQTALSGLHK